LTLRTIIYDRLQDLRERLLQRIEATIETKSADPLSAIRGAIERFEVFVAKHKDEMLSDRITWHEVQAYNEKGTRLPQPFGGEMRFHVKDGLQNYTEQLVFNKNEGALYRLKGAGYRRKEPTFDGLVRKSEHLDLLIQKIEERYKAHKDRDDR
jgi:hypothetical protein